MDIGNIVSLPGYELKEKLGEGGTGWVIKVSKEGKDYACKILRPEIANEAKFEIIRDGFVLEAQRMSENKHRNLVDVFEKGTLKYCKGESEIDLPYFIMELVEGKPLGEWLHEVDGSQEEKLFSLWFKVTCELLEVLRFLHTRPSTPLMHLDIKSQNVMARGTIDKPELKLMDFGVAQKVGGDNLTTRGDNVRAASTYEILPKEWKERITSMKDRNSTFVLIPRDQFHPSIDLHMVQSMIRRISEKEKLGMDYLRGESLFRAKYLDYWLRRMDWDKMKESLRFKSALEALDNSKRVYGWPMRSSILFGKGMLRLPIENLSYFGDRLRAIVNHQVFHRIRRVKQIGMGHYVYPGGTHTRFEHSLGTYNAAIKYLKIIAGNGCPEFRSHLTDEELRMTAAMALVHDIGHYPFAHQINEAKIEGFPTHETVTYDILKKEGFSRNVAREFEINEGDFLQFALYCLENVFNQNGERLPTPEITKRTWTALKLVINGPIDADRFDYLQRDAVHTGVPYTLSFDPERFVNALAVERSEDGSSFELAVREKAISSAEMFAVGRYFMYTSVYYHHTTRVFDRILQEAVYRVTKKRRMNQLFSKIRNMNDDEFISFISKHCDSDVLANAISERQHFKRLITLSEEDSEEYIRIFSMLDFPTRRIADKRFREWLNNELECNYQDGELLIDLPGEKISNTIIPLVSGSGKPIRRHSLFWRAITENFNLSARKLRVFVSHLPKGWDCELRAKLSTHLLQIIKSLQK